MNAGNVFAATTGTVGGVIAAPVFPVEGLHLTGSTAVVVLTLAAVGVATMLAPPVRWVRNRLTSAIARRRDRQETAGSPRDDGWGLAA